MTKPKPGSTKEPLLSRLQSLPPAASEGAARSEEDSRLALKLEVEYDIAVREVKAKAHADAKPAADRRNYRSVCISLMVTAFGVGEGRFR